MQIFFEIENEFEWLNCTNLDLCSNTSLILLDIIKYSSVSYIIFGLLAFIFSIPIPLTVLSCPKLRNKSFILIVNLAVWDMLMSSSFIYKGLKRLYHISVEWPETISQFQCLLEETAMIIGLGGNIVVFLLTAVDRFLAIVFPAWYRLKYPTWLYLSLYFLAYLYLILEVGSLYLYSSDNLFTPICSYPTASRINALKWQGYRTKMVVFATIIIYSVNIFWVYYQLRLAKRKGINLSETRKQLQVKVLWTLFLILSSFVLTIALAHVLYSVALGQRNFARSLNLATFCGTFVCINGVSNFPILYYRTKSFKLAARKLCSCCQCDSNNNIIY